MQLNLVSSRANYAQMNFKENGNECGTQKKISFDKIGSINKAAGDNIDKDLTNSINKQNINRQENPMIEYNERRAVDYDKLDEVFQKFSSSAVHYRQNATPNNLPMRPNFKKLNKVPLRKIELIPHGIPSKVEEKAFSQSHLQPNHKINFLVSKVDQSQHQSEIKINNLKFSQQPGQLVKNNYESSTKIIIPLININAIEMQTIPLITQPDNETSQNAFNSNSQLPILASSKDHINLKCINTGNSSSKDDMNPNRLSRKCLKTIKRLLLQSNNKYQTVNDIVTKSYLFAYNNMFYSLIMNKKGKKILSLSKNEINDKETIYKEETDIFNELNVIKDTINEAFLSQKRTRDSL